MEKEYSHRERKMMKKMFLERPGLGPDFQALISTKGELFLIDLDAPVYWSKRKNAYLIKRKGTIMRHEKFDDID